MDLIVPAKLTAEVDRFVKEVKRLVEVERGGEFDGAWSPQLQSPLLEEPLILATRRGGRWIKSYLDKQCRMD